MFEELVHFVEVQADKDPLILNLVIILTLVTTFLIIAFTVYIIASYRAHKEDMDKMHFVNNELQQKAQEAYLENIQLKKEIRQLKKSLREEVKS